MISDGNSEFIKAAGLSQDLSKIGFGASRPKRFLLIVKDGIVQHVAVGDLDVSSAEAALSKL